MKIANECVVNIEYTLRDDTGEIIDSSDVMGALEYVQGHGMIIPGLETALINREEGEEFSVTIPPVGAYGEVQEDLRMTVGRDQFPPNVPIEVGMRFDAGSGGDSRPVTVTDVQGETIIVDGNHPLAGKTLHFEVAVRSVREATDDDLAALLFRESTSGGCCGSGAGGCGSCGAGCH